MTESIPKRVFLSPDDKEELLKFCKDLAAIRRAFEKTDKRLQDMAMWVQFIAEKSELPVGDITCPCCKHEFMFEEDGTACEVLPGYGPVRL